MPVDFRIFPELGFVHVRCEGVLTVAESGAAFARYVAHPDRHPGQRQLVDLSLVTSVEFNYPALLELQMKKAAAFLEQGDAQTLIVYYAPTPETMNVAVLGQRSWEGISNVVALVQDREDEALELLGLRERRLSEIIALED